MRADAKHILLLLASVYGGGCQPPADLPPRPAYTPDPPKTAQPPADIGFVVTPENAASAGTLLVAEGGAGRLHVKLGQMPDRPQLVTVSTSKPQALAASPQYMVFDPSNFGVPQDVTLTGVKDDDTADEDVKVILSAPEVPETSIDVHVRDSDTQALLLSGSLLSVTEGKTDVLDIQPRFAPTGTMTITIVSRNPSAALPSPTTLTFTAANYKTPQRVTVMGLVDANTTDESVQLAVQSSGLSDTVVSVTVTEK